MVIDYYKWRYLVGNRESAKNIGINNIGVVGSQITLEYYIHTEVLHLSSQQCERCSRRALFTVFLQI